MGRRSHLYEVALRLDVSIGEDGGRCHLWTWGSFEDANLAPKKTEIRT